MPNIEDTKHGQTMDYIQKPDIKFTNERDWSKCMCQPSWDMFIDKDAILHLSPYYLVVKKQIPIVTLEEHKSSPSNYHEANNYDLADA